MLAYSTTLSLKRFSAGSLKAHLKRLHTKRMKLLWKRWRLLLEHKRRYLLLLGAGPEEKRKKTKVWYFKKPGHTNLFANDAYYAFDLFAVQTSVFIAKCTIQTLRLARAAYNHNQPETSAALTAVAARNLTVASVATNNRSASQRLLPLVIANHSLPEDSDRLSVVRTSISALTELGNDLRSNRGSSFFGSRQTSQIPTAYAYPTPTAVATPVETNTAPVLIPSHQVRPVP